MIRNSWIPKSQTPIDTHSSYWREPAANDVRQLAAKAAEILDVKDYARFDFRVRDGIPYLFDIAGTPYTIRHSSIAYLFDQYDLKYEDIYKVIVTCMLSNYRDA